MTKKTEQELKLERELFVTGLQVEVQNWIGDMLDRLGPRAKELDMAIGHVGSAIGSGVASSIFELYRSSNDNVMNANQRKCLEIIKNSFLEGFKEKEELLNDPVALAHSIGLGNKH